MSAWLGPFGRFQNTQVGPVLCSQTRSARFTRWMWGMAAWGGAVGARGPPAGWRVLVPVDQGWWGQWKVGLGPAMTLGGSAEPATELLGCGVTAAPRAASPAQLL